jgi:hypothetical protein
MYTDAKCKSETQRMQSAWWLGYVLDNQEVVVQIPAGARDYTVH